MMPEEEQVKLLLKLLNSRYRELDPLIRRSRQSPLDEYSRGYIDYLEDDIDHLKSDLKELGVR